MTTATIQRPPTVRTKPEPEPEPEPEPLTPAMAAIAIALENFYLDPIRRPAVERILGRKL